MAWTNYNIRVKDAFPNAKLRSSVCYSRLNICSGHHQGSGPVTEQTRRKFLLLIAKIMMQPGFYNTLLNAKHITIGHKQCNYHCPVNPDIEQDKVLCFLAHCGVTLEEPNNSVHWVQEFVKCYIAMNNCEDHFFDLQMWYNIALSYTELPLLSDNTLVAPFMSTELLGQYKSNPEGMPDATNTDIRVLSPSVEANANMDVDADKEQAGPSIEEPIMEDTLQEMDKDVAEAEQEPETWRPKRKGRKVWR
ncbi:uncharacterized protein STEHIDRAFT_112615 [Stereum hirsutum FP-91666 SS1]|uniref:uncharacterized protein n=1 Tax=Stereum hirsutum (strain FP-91666) TaxID=721885 RepID=UPI0004449AAF|nr:uncharacterized protein STEHIDRAFT_112615 [Stereum hirsutum FP-91666 SS1]EIM85160.1 hypothetical protein STEHIDRAFT_112615 [Stereum hirsutum FP-91666 SS1]